MITVNVEVVMRLGEGVVYGDIYLIVNFSMDFLALYLSGRLLSRPLKKLRMISSALLGALYSMLTLVIDMPASVTMITWVAVALMMCALAYPHRTPKSWALSCLVFWGISALLGGMITALSSLANRMLDVRLAGAFSYGSMHFGAFLVLMVLSAVVTMVLGRVIRARRADKSAALTCAYAGRTETITVLVDSGNRLCEPLSGKAAIVVSAEALHTVIPAEVSALMESGDYRQMETLPLDTLRRVRLLPVHTVGHEGVLIGFTPDKVWVNGHEMDAVLALESVPRGSYGTLDGLISPALLHT